MVTEVTVAVPSTRRLPPLWTNTLLTFSVVNVEVTPPLTVSDT
jgi:hypothetical protein